MTLGSNSEENTIIELLKSSVRDVDTLQLQSGLEHRDLQRHVRCLKLVVQFALWATTSGRLHRRLRLRPLSVRDILSA